MGKREEAWRMLRSGMSPGFIRQTQGVTLSTILAYLDQGVGRGVIRSSDIFFSMPSVTRHEVLRSISDKKASNDPRRIANRLKSRGIEADLDDISVTLTYRDTRFAYGDMYEDIRTIETNLHRLVRPYDLLEFRL